MGIKNYEKLRTSGFFYKEYLIVDFKNQDLMEYLNMRGVYPKVRKSFEKKGKEYIFTVCKIKKREEEKFLKILSDFVSEQEKKDVSYGGWCEELFIILHGNEEEHE